jgi:hypothetical protein
VHYLVSLVLDCYFPFLVWTGSLWCFLAFALRAGSEVGSFLSLKETASSRQLDVGSLILYFARGLRVNLVFCCFVRLA